MKKILVPTDFSTEASYAFDVAHEIAKQYNFAQITLLHVMEVPSSAGFNSAGDFMPESNEDLYFVKLMEKVKRQLNEIVTQEQKKGLSIVSKVKFGNPYKSIAEEISSEGVDLIIMGSKGASGIEELLIGSNAEKVVRFAKCPVIIVKQKPKDFKIRDIVLASDFNEEMDSIKKLKEIQELFFAKLHLLYVNTPLNFEPTHVVTKRIKRFAEKYELTNYMVNVYDAHREEEGILEFARTVNPDIIALATHKRKGFLHFVAGSITEDIVNHSKSILFTFPFRERAQA